MVNTHLQRTNGQPDLGSCSLEVEAIGLLALILSQIQSGAPIEASGTLARCTLKSIILV